MKPLKEMTDREIEARLTALLRQEPVDIESASEAWDEMVARIEILQARLLGHSVALVHR